MVLTSGVDTQVYQINAMTFIGAILGVSALVVVLFFLIYSKDGFKSSSFNIFRHNTFVFKQFHSRVLKSSMSDFIFNYEENQFASTPLQPIISHRDVSLSCGRSDSFPEGKRSLKQLEMNSLKDLLGLAEKGKYGFVTCYNECISNDVGREPKPKDLYPIKKKEDIFGPSFQMNTDHSFRYPPPDDICLGSRVTLLDRESQRCIDDSFSDQKLEENDYGENCVLIVPDECNEHSIPRSSSCISSDFISPVVEISLLYDAPLRKMTVHVLQARGIPPRRNGQHTHSQIRLLMLPSKKQKHRTKIRSGENPQFMESFVLHRVSPEDVNSLGLRLRVYSCVRMRKERLIGEVIVSFANVNLELETNLLLPLDTRNQPIVPDSTSDILSLARSESIESKKSDQHGGVPELLLGLAYNGTTGRLIMEIVKGSHLRGVNLNKPPDTYVKICLLNSIGQEMARAKTLTRRNQSNPLFKEVFSFQVALFQLNDVTLMVSVYAKRNMKKNEMIGWFSLGLNSSGPEELAHWVDMRKQGKNILLSRWHLLNMN